MTTQETKAEPRPAIKGFFGRSAWLANSYPVKFRLHGVWWKSVDHYVFACRAINENDREAVREAKTAVEARVVSKEIRWRPDWKEVDAKNIRAAVEAKFTQNAEIGRRLLHTRDIELIHENMWNDRLWGVCNGEGENLLGKLLMEIRDNLDKMEIHQ